MPKDVREELVLDTTPLLRELDESVSDDISDTELVKALPLGVREIVPLTDDPSTPVFTARYFLLLVLFVIPGAFIDTMNSYRTTLAAYLIFFVQIASHWAGQWLAEAVPRNHRWWGINLNPGPWSIKETAMITITASLGATGNLATNALSLADLYFDTVVPAPIALAFMFAIVFIGYSYAAICKDVLVYDLAFPFPTALMQTALLQLQSTHSGRRMKVFFSVLLGVAVWQLFPQFIWPMTLLLAVLCWLAPHDSVLNFVGSGLGGMGFLNFSLDWATITSQIMIYPYWVQVIQFIAFVIGAWVLVPLAKWTSWWSHNGGLMSNGLFTSKGVPYPTEKLLGDDLSLNQTAYAHYGPVYLGPQRAWNMFFDYAAYVSGALWVVLFGWDKIRAAVSRDNHRVADRLNNLAAAYATVQSSWYLALFVLSGGTLVLIFVSGHMFMPLWGCFVALTMGALIVTPLAWLYALSNFQLAIGTFNELVYGYMIQRQEKRHPVGALVFGLIAGDAWYRAQFHLDCMRLGFYNHLPPRGVFLAQLFGECIGIPINYVAVKWVILLKRAFLTGAKTDPLHQWTGQQIRASHTNAIQYVVLGPTRLFANYQWLPYGFAAGLVGPLAIYALHRRYPRAGFNVWNTTVFFLSMLRFYGNILTGYLSKFIGGTVTMFWAQRYRHRVWKDYNYIVAAACDTGLNLAVLALFVAVSVFPQLRMPHWWGNNPDSIERCFAL